MDAFQTLRFAEDNSFVYNPSASRWIRVNDSEALEIPGGRLVQL